MERMVHMERVRDRILLIGSKSLLGEELAPALAEAGFSMARVPSYPEALLSLEVFKPDMIILGHTSEESLEVCHQLHIVFRLPVILIGEDSSNEIWRKALLEAEAEFYVRKPFSTEVLIARMKAMLRRYRQHMPVVMDRIVERRN